MSRLEQLKKLAAMDPADPMTHYSVGLEYINLEAWDDAVGAFKQARAADGDYSAAYYHQARAELSAGRPADAITTLEVGIEVAQRVGDLKTVGEMQELLSMARSA